MAAGGGGFASGRLARHDQRAARVQQHRRARARRASARFRGGLSGGRRFAFRGARARPASSGDGECRGSTGFHAPWAFGRVSCRALPCTAGRGATRARSPIGQPLGHRGSLGFTGGLPWPSRLKMVRVPSSTRGRRHGDEAWCARIRTHPAPQTRQLLDRPQRDARRRAHPRADLRASGLRAWHRRAAAPPCAAVEMFSVRRIAAGADSRCIGRCLHATMARAWRARRGHSATVSPRTAWPSAGGDLRGVARRHENAEGVSARSRQGRRRASRARIGFGTWGICQRGGRARRAARV